MLSSDAWVALQDYEDSVLVDVRSKKEHEQDGMPYLGDQKTKVHRIIWDINSKNPVEGFLDQLDKENIDKSSKVFFICKSGGRSYYAATAAFMSGYKFAISISDGFLGKGGVGAGWISRLPYIYLT